VAVSFADEQLTYRELNARANQLARHLQGLGVGAEVLVGVMMERSVEMVVAVLGILKAGGAYVPLDPQYPRERLVYTLADSAVSILLTQAHMVNEIPSSSGHIVCLDSEWENIKLQSEENLATIINPHQLAYLIYTSGSTGLPKGVMLHHAGLFNLIQAQWEVFALPASSRILQFASLSFDASIFEIALALCRGAALHLVAHASALSGSPLSALLKEQAITTLTLPPSVLATLPVEPLPALQTLIVAGEACGAELAWQWGGGRRFFNAYGPTETTVWATVGEGLFGEMKPPIGRAIANMQVYVLDERLKPVPVGVVGEVHIGGAGLARGYHKRPELTAERFLPDPFSNEAGARLYRTGDLARYLPDGNLEFVGRADYQVKVRGYRIELGEIEAVLGQHPLVRETVVVAREEIPGDKQLVAYLVWKEGLSPTTSELRSYLKERLPEYMVPSAFVLLDELPWTPNGKVDRRALPAPEQSRPEQEKVYVSPRTKLESILTGLWQKMLNIDEIGIYDDFFELGGNSLKAAILSTSWKRSWVRTCASCSYSKRRALPLLLLI
jgi:amino acid adenylation domain-containing protein